MICSHQRCRLTEEQPGAFVIIRPRHSGPRLNFFKTLAFGLKLFLASLCVSSAANIVRTSTGFVQTKIIDTSRFDRPSLLLSAERIDTQLRYGLLALTRRSAFGYFWLLLVLSLTTRSAFGCLSSLLSVTSHHTHER